jgi:hypothetical protein
MTSERTRHSMMTAIRASFKRQSSVAVFIVSNVEYLSYWSRKELVHSNNYLIKIHISYSWQHLICELVQATHCTSHHRLR